MRTKDGVLWIMIGLILHIFPCLGAIGFFSMIVGLFYMFTGRNDFDQRHKSLVTVGLLGFVAGLMLKIISLAFLYSSFLSSDTTYLFTFINVAIYTDFAGILLIFCSLLSFIFVLSDKPSRGAMVVGILILFIGLLIINITPITFDGSRFGSFGGGGFTSGFVDDFNRRASAIDQFQTRYLYEIPVEICATIIFLIVYLIMFQKLRRLDTIERMEEEDDGKIKYAYKKYLSKSEVRRRAKQDRSAYRRRRKREY